MSSEHKKVQPNPPRLSPDERGFPFYPVGIGYGLLAGILMAVYLIILNASFDGLKIGARFAKYFLMILPVYFAIRNYKIFLPDGKIFKDGLKLGALLSVTAALFLAIANYVLANINPNIAFEMFGHENTTLGDTIANSVFLAFEVFVFGMVLTFAAIQLMKDGQPADG